MATDMIPTFPAIVGVTDNCNVNHFFFISNFLFLDNIDRIVMSIITHNFANSQKIRSHCKWRWLAFSIPIKMVIL